MSASFKIIDAHLHFQDSKANHYPVFDQVDPNFVALVGDYSALPRRYLLENYLQDTANYQIDGVVWHEFISADPIKEVKWAQQLAEKSSICHALVALIDFLDPNLEEKLEVYAALPNVTAVREHIGWDNESPARRFAKRPDLLSDTVWQQGLNKLNQYHFKCGLEIFAHQLPDLIKVIEKYPNIGFTIALMAWPVDLSQQGYLRWLQAMKQLGRCENVRIEISAIECIFGMNWTLEQVKPWILSTIEIFGTARCMFGSHMPIAKLSHSFSDLYKVYETIVGDFSASEKENLFHSVAADWFKLINAH